MPHCIVSRELQRSSHPEMALTVTGGTSYIYVHNIHNIHKVPENIETQATCPSDP